MRLEALVLAVLVSILLAISQILLKLSLEHRRLAFGFLPAESPMFWGAMLTLALAGILWIQALRFASLGRLYPLLSLSYVVVLVVSVLWLREPIRIVHVVGVFFIAIGIALVLK